MSPIPIERLDAADKRLYRLLRVFNSDLSDTKKKQEVEKVIESLVNNSANDGFYFFDEDWRKNSPIRPIPNYRLDLRPYKMNLSSERVAKIERASDKCMDQLLLFYFSDDDPYHLREASEKLISALKGYLEYQGRDVEHIKALRGRKGVRKKRKLTDRRAAESKIISGLIKHHGPKMGRDKHSDYLKNAEPVRDFRSLSEMWGVAESSITHFLKKQFGGHKEYASECRRNPQLVARKLATLIGELTPSELYQHGLQIGSESEKLMHN